MRKHIWATLGAILLPQSWLIIKEAIESPINSLIGTIFALIIFGVAASPILIGVYYAKKSIPKGILYPLIGAMAVPFLFWLRVHETGERWDGIGVIYFGGMNLLVYLVNAGILLYSNLSKSKAKHTRK